MNYYVDRFFLSLWLPMILYLGLPMGIIFKGSLEHVSRRRDLARDWFEGAK